jgi:AraC family transcriptional regulator
MNVTIKNQPELRVAGIRHIGPYHEIGRAFGRLGGILAGPPPPGAQMIAIFHDDPDTTPPDKLRSDATLSLPQTAHAPNGLIEQRIPAGRYATVVHTGAYEELPKTWARLKKEWLPANGHRAANPSYEVYLNNPMTTPKADLLTEIFLRLA